MNTLETFWLSPVTERYFIDKSNDELAALKTLDESEIILPENPDYIIKRTIKVIGKHFNVSEEQLKTKNRAFPLVWARELCMYFINKHTLLNYRQVGEIFNRERTTAIHAERRVMDLMETERSTLNQVSELEGMI